MNNPRLLKKGFLFRSIHFLPLIFEGDHEEAYNEQVYTAALKALVDSRV
jgi:hypothetical protein